MSKREIRPSEQIPHNEFSAFSSLNGDMATMDSAYHHYHKDYKKHICVKCSVEFWRKNDDPVESDLCGLCIGRKL